MRLKYFDFDSSFSARSRYYTAMGLSGKYTGNSSQNVNMLKLMRSHGYKNGSFNIPDDELDWIHGKEMIYRSSDGALLSVLPESSKVFTAEMADNLWNIAKGNMPQNLVPVSTMPSVVPVSGGNTSNNYNMDIELILPNATNLEDIRKSLERDRDFNRWFDAKMGTLGPGKSSFSVHRYIK